MNKSAILVASLTLGVLLIVASLFVVSAGKPMKSEIGPNPVEPNPDKDQYCKDNYPTDKDCTLGKYQCKDDMPDGKHICSYVCQKQADNSNGWNFEETCNALDGCDAKKEKCKKDGAIAAV